jgi:hypothetical protein
MIMWAIGKEGIANVGPALHDTGRQLTATGLNLVLQTPHHHLA